MRERDLQEIETLNKKLSQEEPIDLGVDKIMEYKSKVANFSDSFRPKGSLKAR